MIPRKIDYKQNEKMNAIVAYDRGKPVGEVGFVRQGTDVLVLDHTTVDMTYRGMGIGLELVKQIVELARTEHKKIRVMCPFARKIFSRTPAYNDVLMAQGR